MTQTITTEHLWDETRRLTAEIEELQIRLEYLMDNEEQDDAETWNVWPYSSAIAGWNRARACFHSLHQKHQKSPEATFDTASGLRLV